MQTLLHLHLTCKAVGCIEPKGKQLQLTLQSKRLLGGCSLVLCSPVRLPKKGRAAHAGYCSKHDWCSCFVLTCFQEKLGLKLPALVRQNHCK